MVLSKILPTVRKSHYIDSWRYILQLYYVDSESGRIPKARVNTWYSTEPTYLI